MPMTTNLSRLGGEPIFVYSRLSETARRLLREHVAPDAAVVFRADLPDDAQQAAFRSAAVVLGNPPAAWFTEPLPSLQFWQLDSAGFDGYKDVRLNVPVANVGDLFAWPCAETMVAGILALYRRIAELAVLQSRTEWVGARVRRRTDLLLRKSVVILGAGAIGQAVGQMLTGFDCRVQFLARTDPRADLHSLDDLKAALPQTDVVINCLPGTAAGFVSADVIAAMQPGSLYANVGRGSTTDEPALIAALQTGHLGGAVLDVTQTEPLPADSPLWTLPNVLLTQHTGGGRPDEDEGKVEAFLRNWEHFVNGEPLEHPVDLTKGY